MLIDRVVGALRLDVDTYEEIEHAKDATAQSAILIAILAFALGFRDYIQWTMNNEAVAAYSPYLPSWWPTLNVQSPTMAAISTFVNVFVIWLVASAVINFTGKAFFSADSNLSEILRVTGFAQVPRLFEFLALGGVIPCFSPLILLGAALWTLAANVIGIRQGLDISTGKTVIVIILSYLIAYLLSLAITYVFTLF